MNNAEKQNSSSKSSALKRWHGGVCALVILGSLLGNYMQCNKNDTSKGSKPFISRLFNDTPVVSNVVSNNDNTVSFDLKKQEGLYAKKGNPFQFYYKNKKGTECQYIPASAEEASEITKSVVAEMYKDQINVSENQWCEVKKAHEPSKKIDRVLDDSAGLKGFFDTKTGLAIAMEGDKVVAVNGVKVQIGKAGEQGDSWVDKYLREWEQKRAGQNKDNGDATAPKENKAEAKAEDKLFIMAGTSKLEVSDAFLPVLKQIVESANESAKKSAEEQQDKKKKEAIAESVSFEQKVNYKNMSR